MKQKRYASERKILDEIDRCRSCQTKALFAIAELDGEVKAYLKLNNPSLREEIAWRKSESGKCRRSLERYETKIAELGQKLAAFRTELLPMNGNTDKGVV